MARGDIWYWLYGQKEGRAFRSGPYSTREKCASEGIRFCGADFEVMELPTHNTAEAGRMIKHQIAHRLGIGAGFLKHKLGAGDNGQQQTTGAQPQDEGW